MFWKRPVLPPAASFLLIASVCAVLSVLRVNDVWADDHSSVAIGSARGTDAGEFVVTLAGRCTLSSFRLPDRVETAQFAAGECADDSVARSANQTSLYVGGRDGTIGALSLPDLKRGRRHWLGGPIGRLLARPT